MQGQWVRGGRAELPSASWLTQLAGSLRDRMNRQGWRVKPAAEEPYTLQLSEGTAYVAFRGRIARKTVLALLARIEKYGAALRAVEIDAAGIEGLDARGLAMLAMLCSALERDGRHPRVSGVPHKLYLAAIEARIHHLVNFG